MYNECECDDCIYYQKEIRGQPKVYVDHFSRDNIDGTFSVGASFPFESFKIYEDGDIYCEGIVFDIKDVH